MKRDQFLKTLGMTTFLMPLIGACSKSDDPSASGACTVTNTETAGPFPTKTPSGLVLTDIRADRTGVDLAIKITIQNKNCVALTGAIVDIWHCDKDGYYSEYGGTGMQSVDYTGSQYHFLRGRQTTDSNGQIGFSSIFPGWYSGRATHIHVHIYSATGASLLVTQIAFPEGSGSAVNLVNASSVNGYTKGMTGYTNNASDNVFSDGVTSELSSITGSVAAGFELTHTIVVNV